MTGFDIDRHIDAIGAGNEARATAVSFFLVEYMRLYPRIADDAKLEQDVEATITRCCVNYMPRKGVLSHYMNRAVACVVRGHVPEGTVALEDAEEGDLDDERKVALIETGTLSLADALCHGDREFAALAAKAEASLTQVERMQLRICANIADAETREHLLCASPTEAVTIQRTLEEKLRNAA